MPEASLSEKELPSVGGRLLSDYSAPKEEEDEDVEITLGRPASGFHSFPRIHNGTVTLEGTVYPSIKAAVISSDPDSLCSSLLDFTWEFVSFERDEIVLLLIFGSPECVSSSGGDGDLLVITFYDQNLFEGKSGKLIWPETRVTRHLGR